MDATVKAIHVIQGQLFNGYYIICHVQIQNGVIQSLNFKLEWNRVIFDRSVPEEEAPFYSCCGMQQHLWAQGLSWFDK